MDYGQGSQFAGSDNQPFFTAGTGNISPSQNYFESAENLDLTNPSSWNRPRDYREIGNRAFMSPNDLQDSTEETLSQQGQSHNQAPHMDTPPTDYQNNHEITPTMPPMASTTSEKTPTTYDKQSIRSDGDRISSHTIVEIKQAISKLSQTDDVADFYVTIRGSKDSPGMLQDYLKNSYNREVA